jgi:hypothetical protein
VALPLAFDHVPLDQFLNIARIEGSRRRFVCTFPFLLEALW